MQYRKTATIEAEQFVPGEAAGEVLKATVLKFDPDNRGVFVRNSKGELVRVEPDEWVALEGPEHPGRAYTIPEAYFAANYEEAN